MSDMGWLVVVVIIMLGFIAGVFVVIWRSGEGSKGLKDELGQRVMDLEIDRVKIWKELKRLDNRWVP